MAHQEHRKRPSGVCLSFTCSLPMPWTRSSPSSTSSTMSFFQSGASDSLCLSVRPPPSSLWPLWPCSCCDSYWGRLIEGEDFQFRDMRVASTLLKLHTVLCSAPYSAVATNAAPEVSIRVKPCSQRLGIFYCILYCKWYSHRKFQYGVA